MLQVRYSWMGGENTRTSAEAITQGAAVQLSGGQWVIAPQGGGTGIAMQSAEVLSEETKNIFSGSYWGYRNPYKISTTNVGDCLAVLYGPAIIDGFTQYLGTVAVNDKLYVVGSAGKLGNATTLVAASGTAANCTVVARAETAGTSDDPIRIALLSL